MKREVEMTKARLLKANQETERQELESLRSSLSKTEAIRDGLKKKLEKAYFDLEEAQLEITAIKRTQETGIWRSNATTV